MSQDPARRFRRWQGLVTGLCSLMLAAGVPAGELPPPPSSLESMADAQLFLELVINQMNTGKVVAVEQRSGRLVSLLYISEPPRRAPNSDAVFCL